MKGGKGATGILHGGGVDLKKLRDEALAAAKAMLAIVAIAFAADLLILWLLDRLGQMHLPGWVLGSAALALALVIAPGIYYLVLIPLRREYERRLEAEGRAQEMTRLAITDPLTHTMNRRGITVALLDAMAQAERYDTPLTVAMADIDHFKDVNDRYGHEAGDRALAAKWPRCSRSSCACPTRSGVTVARSS